MGSEVLERFGKYFLLDRIGSGGMAEIFRARPASIDANGRIMVVKRMLPQVASEPQFLNMFRSETQVCMAFNHPNLIQIHDFGETAKRAYLAMEYIEGKNLRDLAVAFARENELMPIPMAVNIVEQAARGLHYAHVFKNNATGERLNMVHRDVSPHNILLSFEGNVKVIDFGIAKAEVENYDATRDGIIKGKVGYLSPEQVEGKKLDARSDIFALGIVLWELLTGRRLFMVPGQSDLAILQAIQHCDQHIVPPSSANTRVPRELDAIVMQSLSQDPAVRFATAEEFASALRRFASANCPAYGAGEVSAGLKKMFHDRIEEDHRCLQELNLKAQHVLSVVSRMPPLPPAVAAPPPPTSAVSVSAIQPPPLPGRRRILPFITRGRTIGALVYALTILFIKLDQQYFFVGRFLLPTDVVRKVAVLETAKLSPPQAGQAPVQALHSRRRAPASRAK